MAQKQAVIIGAGIGGLATAAILAKAGWKVDIYDNLAQAGGRTGQLEVDGFRFDTSPSWYLMPEVVEHYFSLLGERIEDHLQLHKLSPAYKAFFDYRRPLQIYADETRDNGTFEALETGAATHLSNYVARAGRTYDLAMRHFLYNPFTDKGTLLAPGILSQAPFLIRQSRRSIDDYVQGYVHSLALRQMLEYPTIFLGSSPDRAPALYHMMSHLDFRQGVQYVMGGMYEIVHALQNIGAKYGVKYHFKQTVTGIMTEANRATGIRLKSGHEHLADIVVSDADLHFTETELLPEAARSYPSSYWEQKEAGSSALIMHLGVRGELPQLKHHNLLFLEKWQAQDGFKTTEKASKKWPERASMYVARPSATDSTVAPEDHEALTVMVPLPSVKITQKQIEICAARYIAQLADMADIPDLAERIVVKQLSSPADFAATYNTWQGAVLGSSLTLNGFLRPRAKSHKLNNLYYAGQFGIGMPMSLIGAELVYKRLIDDRSAGPLSDLEEQPEPSRQVSFADETS